MMHEDFKGAEIMPGKNRFNPVRTAQALRADRHQGAIRVYKARCHLRITDLKGNNIPRSELSETLKAQLRSEGRIA